MFRPESAKYAGPPEPPRAFRLRFSAGAAVLAFSLGRMPRARSRRFAPQGRRALRVSRRSRNLPDR